MVWKFRSPIVLRKTTSTTLSKMRIIRGIISFVSLRSNAQRVEVHESRLHRHLSFIRALINSGVLLAATWPRERHLPPVPDWGELTTSVGELKEKAEDLIG